MPAGKPPPAQQLTCDVRAEAASVLTMASDVGWTLGRLEEGIKNCKGNVDSIFSVCLSLLTLSEPDLSKLQFDEDMQTQYIVCCKAV